MDTIYALATAQGKAGVAVVRVSGPAVPAAAEALAGALPDPRKAILARLRDSDGLTIDHALVLAFAAPRSFTGEAVVEFHTHGGRAVTAAVLRSLGALPDLRLAEAGEFTRRALRNGKLDLTEVEGLADLIDAETEAQRRQALRLFSGALGARVEGWRADLVRASALLAASIDFADEEVPSDLAIEVARLIQGVREEIDAERAGSGAAERIRDGFEVAILGAPNVGKSTLLNALAGRQAALTSAIAGTTRDVIEVRMDLNGLPVTLLDTAGLRETGDHVESLGIDLARRRAKQADLRVVLTDGPLPAGLSLHRDDIVVAAKADLTGCGVSGLTGQGVAELLGEIGAALESRAAGAGLAVQARHRSALDRGSQALARAETVLAETQPELELVAEELRAGIAALDALVGRVDVEDVLDVVFQSFCLGK